MKTKPKDKPKKKTIVTWKHIDSVIQKNQEEVKKKNDR